jgi:hypothetical protein
MGSLVALPRKREEALRVVGAQEVLVEDYGVDRPGVDEQDCDRPGVDHRVPGEVFQRSPRCSSRS